MHAWLEITVLVLTGLALAAVLVALVRNVSGDGVAFALLGAVEVALVVQAVVGLVALSSTERDVAGPVFVAYLLGGLLLVPAGALWSLAERSRGGIAVLVVTCLAVAGVVARLHQIWWAHGG
jgi:hypothetical protein